MPQPPTFETARLTLRPFTGDDVDALAPVFDDPRAMWDILAIPGMPREPRAIAKKRIAESIAGWNEHDAGFWAVTIRAPEVGSPGEVIGYCGFVNPTHAEPASQTGETLEVGWAIHPAYQRRGLASEAAWPVLEYAFGRRGFARLVAITHPDNHASRALMERLGFAFDAGIDAYGAPQVRYVLDRAAYRKPPSR